MTSTRRGSGSGGCMWTGEPMWRSTLKIIFYTCNCNISMCTIVILFKGSSIYDVHTEGVWLRWMHVDGGAHVEVHTEENHRTNRFKRVMCILCRPHVDIHKGKGFGSCGQGQKVKS